MDGLYPGTRDGNTIDSSAEAGTAQPASCSTAPRSTSYPRPRLLVMPCQAGRKRASALGIDRLDLLAERGQRPAPQQPEHLAVAPLHRHATGQELALDHPPGRSQPPQRLGHDGDAGAEMGGQVDGTERAVRPGIPRHQIAERIRHRLGVRLGHSRRHRYAEGVAQAGDVLDDGPAVLAGDPHPHHPPGGGQVGQPGLGVGAVDTALCSLADRQRPDQP